MTIVILKIDLAKCFEEQYPSRIKAFEDYFAGKINGANLAILIQEDVPTTQRLIAGLVSAAVMKKFGCSATTLVQEFSLEPTAIWNEK